MRVAEHAPWLRLVARSERWEDCDRNGPARAIGEGRGDSVQSCRPGQVGVICLHLWGYGTPGCEFIQSLWLRPSIDGAVIFGLSGGAGVYTPDGFTYTVLARSSSGID